MEVMKSKLFLVLPFLCFMGIGFLANSNLLAGKTLDDGLLWLTRTEINEKFGKPTFLYSEEEPWRRYKLAMPENEDILRATFLYDVVVHDFYYLTKNGMNCEVRFYYGEDFSGGQKTYRVKEYYIKFLDGPVPIGRIAEFIPEFKPAYGATTKVYQERLLNVNNIRLTFVTGQVNELSQCIGSQFVDLDKDIKDWSLSYDIILCDGEPENVSVNSMAKEITVCVDGEYRIGKTAHVFGSKLIKNPLQ